jgi:hypothetical protein
MESDPPPPVRMNPRPGVDPVGERLGYHSKTALTLGRFVAGSSVRAKARRLGIIDMIHEAEERRVRAMKLKRRR